MKIRMLLAVSLVMILLLGACGGDDDNQTATPIATAIATMRPLNVFCQVATQHPAGRFVCSSTAARHPNTTVTENKRTTAGATLTRKADSRQRASLTAEQCRLADGSGVAYTG
mgnify:CR=1 FL=1